MKFADEFKAFALKGNVVDLAVGVIIGGAFSKIVESLVGDLIMPLVSGLFGGLDFSNYYIPLAGQAAELSLLEAKKLGAVFAYGSFLTVALNFLMLAFIIFVAVRQMNRLLNTAEPNEQAAVEASADQPESVQLLREIRDALTKR